MGVLDVLSGAANAAGQGFAGYSQDQQLQVKNLLAQAQAAREAETARVNNLVALGGINPDLQGAISGARDRAGVQPGIDQAVGTAAGLAPIKTKQAVDEATQLAPIHTNEAAATAAALSPIHTTEAANTATALIDPKVAEQTAMAPGIVSQAGQVAGAEESAKLPGELQIARARAAMTPEGRLAAVALPAMIDADKTMTALEQSTDGTPGALQSLFGKDALGNYITPDKVQQYQNAARDFVTNQAQLTGRPLTEPGIQAGMQTYSALGGNSPGAIAQKAQDRAAVIARNQSLGGSAPPAAPTGGSGDPEFDALMAKLKKPPQ